MQVWLANKNSRPWKITLLLISFKTQQKLKNLATFFNSEKKQSNKILEMLECEFKNLLSHRHWKSNQLVIYSSLGFFWKSGNYIWLFYIIELYENKLKSYLEKVYLFCNMQKLKKHAYIQFCKKLPRQYLTYAAA